jgi:hypothetical protein
LALSGLQGSIAVSGVGSTRTSRQLKVGLQPAAKPAANKVAAPRDLIMGCL